MEVVLVPTVCLEDASHGCLLSLPHLFNLCTRVVVQCLIDVADKLLDFKGALASIDAPCAPPWPALRRTQDHRCLGQETVLAA